jgi:hypothetical protein
MADDLSKTGSQDRERISLTQDHELDYWTEALGVSEPRLREAVAAVGHMAKDVRKYLGIAEE